MSLEIFYEKVAKRLLGSAGTEFQVQGQTGSPAGRLVGRDHFLYRIPVSHVRLEGKSQCSCHVSADQKNCEEMHYNVLHKMRCWTLYGAVF